VSVGMAERDWRSRWKCETCHRVGRSPCPPGISGSTSVARCARDSCHPWKTPNQQVSDDSQTPLAVTLCLSESAGSRSLDRLVRCILRIHLGQP
jgi:hypothetical protein